MTDSDYLLLGAGLSGYLVIYGALVWLVRPRAGKVYLWIASWSACAFVYQLGRHRQLTAPSVDAMRSADRLCLATAVLLVPSIVVVIRELTGERRWSWAPRALFAAAGVIIAVHVPTELFVTSDVDHYRNLSGHVVAFSRVGPLYVPALLPLSVAAFVYAVAALRRAETFGATERTFWIVGAASCLLLGVNDLLLFSGAWARLAPDLPARSLFELGLVALAVALTLRMAHRAALQHVELEQLVEQRTSALSAALARATHAAEAKSAFLASVSHEVRTPLNGIIGLTELMLQRPLPVELKTQLTAVQQSGVTLRKLVDELLDFSKLDAKRVTLDLSRVVLPRLFDEVVSLYRGMASVKGVELRVEHEGLPAVVRVDEMRLRQIVSNLVVNAVKFTDRGEVRIRAHGRRVSDTEVALHVEVIDTGCGIADADVQRLFQPFTQLSGRAQPSRGGTGLGLALCRELLSLMGGSIAVRSEPGVGSTFWFDVLLQVHHWDVISDDMLATGDPRPPSAPAADEPLQRGGRVLVAEDNAVNRLVATGLLKSLGWDVDTVTDGQQAIEAVERERYDLVLMDCQMPVLDGLEATRQLRARGRDVPIIALTAYAADEDRKRCLTAGMDDYLAKPVTRSELEAAIARIARVRGART
ncbi:ATP-binding protein [Myxococcota bacterium]|nr:ATP-binding protein [Myxococcota bacterium]